MTLSSRSACSCSPTSATRPCAGSRRATRRVAFANAEQDRRRRAGDRHLLRARPPGRAARPPVADRDRQLALHEHPLRDHDRVPGLALPLPQREPSTSCATCSSSRWALALVGYALFPTAPPRLLPELGFVDTITDFSQVNHDSALVKIFVNPYAAVPSMHIAFALMIADPGGPDLAPPGVEGPLGRSTRCSSSSWSSSPPTTSGSTRRPARSSPRSRRSSPTASCARTGRGSGRGTRPGRPRELGTSSPGADGRRRAAAATRLRDRPRRAAHRSCATSPATA